MFHNEKGTNFRMNVQGNVKEPPYKCKLKHYFIIRNSDSREELRQAFPVI